MSKYVDRIMEEVHFNFERHYTDKEEQVEFLEELIEVLRDELEEIMNTCESGEDCDCCDRDDECGVCPEGECDCEPEVCI